MLNFRNTNIFFVLLILFLSCYAITVGLPISIWIASAVIYLLLLFYGSYYIGSNFYFPVICSITTNKKQIAISFDDGPVFHNTTEILRILETSNVEAAFFCIGQKIKGNESLLQQIHEQGHIIGNHSFSHHRWFDLFSSHRMCKDMQLMTRAVREVLGLEPRLFRPPYGVTNPTLKKAIKSCHLTSIGWSIRSLDTIIKDRDKLMEKVMRSVKPGAILLFHDTSAATIAILPNFLNTITGMGYEIIRLDKMLKLDAYA